MSRVTWIENPNCRHWSRRFLPCVYCAAIIFRRNAPVIHPPKKAKPKGLTPWALLALLRNCGMKCGVIVPTPSYPDELSPQAHNVPSSRTAVLWSVPADTDVHVVPSCIRTGTLRPVPVPSPSWPPPFHPQAQSVPVVLMRSCAKTPPLANVARAKTSNNFLEIFADIERQSSCAFSLARRRVFSYPFSETSRALSFIDGTINFYRISLRSGLWVLFSIAPTSYGITFPFWIPRICWKHSSWLQPKNQKLIWWCLHCNP